MTEIDTSAIEKMFKEESLEDFAVRIFMERSEQRGDLSPEDLADIERSIRAGFKNLKTNE